MIIKNHFVDGVKEFIAIMEHYSVEGMTRGEHETCVLASNLLRRSLNKGLPEEVWVSTELAVNGKNIDFLLVGESNGKMSICILEYKQWTNVKLSSTGDGYHATIWGTKPAYHKFGEDKDDTLDEPRERCPYFQISGYREAVEKLFPHSEIYSALVFPNMVDDTWAKKMELFVKKQSMQHDVFIQKDLEELAEKMVTKFSKGPSTVRKWEINSILGKGSVGMEKSKDFIETTGPTFYEKASPHPPGDTRHGWVGGVDAFIENCEKNEFAKIFIGQSVAERRAIIFSSNHLATVLRKMRVDNEELAKHLCVVLEFKLMASDKRIDVVLAMQGESQDAPSLFAIEIKAWSNAFEKSTFKVHEESIGGQRLPSTFSYPAGGGEERAVMHPVEQVNHYVQDLYSEYDDRLGGCAWLHNIHTNTLKGEIKNLHIKKHVVNMELGSKYYTIFQGMNETIFPMVTRTKEYSWAEEGKQTRERNLQQVIETYFSRWIPSKFNHDSLERLCDLEPSLSQFCIDQAFRNANNILDSEWIGPLQKKIAEDIIKCGLEAIKTPTKKTIITVKGDAGTGKTFVALAVIGKILEKMTTEPNQINYPAMICANNPAAKAIIRDCRSSTSANNGMNVGPLFIKSRQDFLSNPEYMLAHRLKGVYDVKVHGKSQNEKVAPILLYDESQLLSHYSDSQMVALAGHKKDHDFLDWLETQSYRSKTGERMNLRTDIEVLSKLSSVSVVFLDERQATRSSAIGNLNIENIKDFANKSGIDLLEFELKKAYRNEDDYMNLLKHILYDESAVKSTDTSVKNKFEVSVATDGEDFIKKFNNRVKQNPDKGFSCGMVAGYTKEHLSSKKGKENEIDWVIGGEEFQWNESPGNRWIFSEQNRKERIGYFLAVQGNELDELFVYIADDLYYDSSSKKICVNLEKHRKESDCRKYTGATDDEKRMCIVNQYWVLLTRAKKKVTIFCKDSKLNDFFKQKLKDFRY